MTSHPALSVRGLHAWYGESHVLHGVDLKVARGEVVTLLGRNGAGRTTTLRAILGLVGKRRGSIQIDGRETTDLVPHEVARLGVGYCPEERGIFTTLSTAENLALLPALAPGGMSDGELFAMFPNLHDRRATPGGQLSGGEQQMLAMARILRAGSRLLLLDEITEGLAPVIVRRLGEVIHELREKGYTLLLVEQNFRFAAPLADRHYVMSAGRIVGMVRRDELRERREFLQTCLGV
jgi:branched-chain amino acid transport system ATP-binding protein